MGSNRELDIDKDLDRLCAAAGIDWWSSVQGNGPEMFGVVCSIASESYLKGQEDGAAHATAEAEARGYARGIEAAARVASDKVDELQILHSSRLGNRGELGGAVKVREAVRALG
jgi:hypothetical protein